MQFLNETRQKERGEKKLTTDVYNFKPGGWDGGQGRKIGNLCEMVVHNVHVNPVHASL